MRDKKLKNFKEFILSGISVILILFLLYNIDEIIDTVEIFRESEANNIISNIALWIVGICFVILPALKLVYNTVIGLLFGTASQRYIKLKKESYVLILNRIVITYTFITFLFPRHFNGDQWFIYSIIYSILIFWEKKYIEKDAVNNENNTTKIN